MNDQQLERLMLTHGPGHPAVANALSQLPDGHPLKDQPVDAPSIPGTATPSPPDETTSRLDDIEARLAAIEALL